MRSLKEELVELRRSQTAQRVQFDDFRNRLVVLQDKLDSERLARRRRGRATAMPQLPRVVLRRPALRGTGEAMPPTGPRIGAPQRDPRRLSVARAAPAAPSRGTGRASRTIVIGPDNIPHVTDTRSRKKILKSRKKRRRVVAAGPRAGGAGATPQGGVTREERAAGAYRAAKSLLDAGRLREARTQFTDFIRKHPRHPLADNAMYWIGETWYAQAMWIKAAGVFHKVVQRYAGGNKVPDAMLKMALCYRKLGERNDAQAVLRELIRRFPTTSAADLARRKLSQSTSGSPGSQRY